MVFSGQWRKPLESLRSRGERGVGGPGVGLIKGVAFYSVVHV